MKISKLREIIDEMRGIYRFRYENTNIKMVDDPRMMEHYVELSTKDEKTGVEIILHKGIHDGE